MLLKKFNVGENFISWIKLLYSRILINSTISSRFDLHRGTRQSCSLSPHLFALAIEPLAEAIRAHAGIKGYKIRNMNNKLWLYAHDIILFISEPNSSIPNIFNLINLPFKFASEQFTYLGIEVTKKFPNLVV